MIAHWHEGFHIYGIFLIFGLYTSNGAIRSGWEIPEDTLGGKTLRKYFELETARLESRSLAEIETPVDWKAQRSKEYFRCRKCWVCLPWKIVHP